VHPKLAWVGLLSQTLSEVLATSVVASCRDSVDPLKKFIVFDMGSPLSKGNYNPLQKVVHAYSKANDCVVTSIRREGPRRLVLETLIKNRVSPEMKNDPFLSDKAEPPKEG
jgi:hypothetical protein